MLRLIKNHLAACKKTSEKDWKCFPKTGKARVACPFLVVGPDPRDPTAPRIKKHTKTSDERIAKDFLLRFELSLYENPKNRSLRKRHRPKRLMKPSSIILGRRNARASHGSRSSLCK